MTTSTGFAQELLEPLLAGRALSRAEAKALIPAMTSGALSSAQVAIVLTIFKMRPPNAEELSGLRDAMLELATPLNLEGVDLCGTGGDGKSTFNISTLASFVVAAAGVPVVKHGNYSASSACGSSNLLEALSVPLPADAAAAGRILTAHNIVFLHAPFWHPAMKSVSAVRKELGFRTIFNLLGPIVNPCRPKAQLLGVFNSHAQRLYAETLKGSLPSYFIVHSKDGYDEVSLTGEAQVLSPEGLQTLMPSDFGFEAVQPGDLKAGANIADIVELSLNILKAGACTPKTNVVVANAALAILAFQPKQGLKSSIARAEEALYSGRALAVLEGLRHERA